MNSVRPLGARSSLLSHSFPSFYACYLLKSIQTPQSTAIYIGSTPSPPRRIRQHNGELTQGARRTRSKRPWVMQMIVHGFPSRLAALQFEWAWQNPHKSRHLRDANGNIFGTRAAKILKKNIIIVRAMISKHPFNAWPLHVKLFTEEAVQLWKAAAADVSPLPPGFTCTVELEGVDGKSGHPGSGRQGPINVDDSEFTSALLAKNTALLASGHSLDCSICHEPIENYSTEPLKAALCPSSECVAVSHLHCLSRNFLNEQREQTSMVPRGGHCKSCGNYTLWGDIIRGCYRRMPSVDQHPDVATDDMFLSDEDDNENATPLKKSARRKGSASPSKRHVSTKGKEKAVSTSQSSAGELFDFTNIVSSSESNDGTTPMKRTPGRPRKNAGAASPFLSPIISPWSDSENMPDNQDISSTKTKPGRSRNASSPTLSRTGGRKKSLSPLTVASGSDSEDMKGRSKGARKSSPATLSPALGRRGSLSPATVALGSDGKYIFSTKRKPGRPPKSPPVTLSPASPIGTKKTRAMSPSKIPNLRRKSSSSEGEFFDFDNITSSSESEDYTPVKRGPGRPRKHIDLLTTGTPSPTVSPKTTQGIGVSPSPNARALKSKKSKEKAIAMVPAGSKDEGFASIPEGDYASHVPPTKRKPGRPRKSIGRPSLGIAETPNPRSEQEDQRRHYSTWGTGTKYLDADSTSGESFAFSQIIDSDSPDEISKNLGFGRRDQVHLPKASSLKSKNKVLSDFKDGIPLKDGQNQALSARSVSTRIRTLYPDRACHDKDIEVIVLSD